ncbi:hypothetical protein [Sporisorium scitamineum]|nr:hypothetical protein [Sporisorium scitamineum]
MEILDALQDIRTRNARLERVDTDAVLAKLHDRAQGPLAEGTLTAKSIEEQEQAKAQEEDEALVQKYFGKALDGSHSSNGVSNGVTVKRKLDEEAEAEPDMHTLLAMKAASSNSIPTPTVIAPAVKKKKNAPNAFGLVRKKK